MNLNGIDASAFTRQLEEQALGPDDTFAFPVIVVAAVAVNEKTFCSTRRICSALQSF